MIGDKSKMGLDERAAFSGLSSQELQEIEAATASKLLAINKELKARDFISSQVRHNASTVLAQAYVADLRRHQLQAGDMMAVVGWMELFIKKEISRQAIKETELELEMEANARLAELRAANTRMGGHQ